LVSEVAPALGSGGGSADVSAGLPPAGAVVAVVGSGLVGVAIGVAVGVPAVAPEAAGLLDPDAPPVARADAARL
jgi:hypothetical protein